MTILASFPMPTMDPDHVQDAFLTGLELATATIVATILLELLSWETAVAAYKKDKQLYLQAVALNFLNHYAFGVPVYMAGDLFLCRPMDESYSAYFVALQVIIILFVHSVCYYQAHKGFHSAPGYYKYHKFHHRFNTHVPPMSANAVGLVEYLFAYVLPFTVAAAVVRPYGVAVKLSVYIISFSNLSIHTPKIEAWSEKNIPAFWVSTHDHLEHHRKLNVHYGAPTFNIDWAARSLEKRVDTAAAQEPTAGMSTSIR